MQGPCYLPASSTSHLHPITSIFIPCLTSSFQFSLMSFLFLSFPRGHTEGHDVVHSMLKYPNWKKKNTLREQWMIWGNHMMPLDWCTELCSLELPCCATASKPAIELILNAFHKSSSVLVGFAMLLSLGPTYLSNSFLCLNLLTV